jgi:hypothetical protein
MTVLFRSDWGVPIDGFVPVCHTETTNKSFWKMAIRLKQMNIQNNLFHLCLYDKDLIGRDPHNLTDPSDELRGRIALECKRNVWYFIREVVRIPASGGDPIPFALHRGNLAMVWAYYNNIDFTSTQPRQTGKTVCAIVITCHVIYVFGFNIRMGMFTKDSKLLQENVSRLKSIRDSLPQYIIKPSTNDTDAKEGLSYAHLGNVYNTYVGQKDKQAAHNLGRGMTSPTLHVDEPAFISNIHISYPVIMASTTEAVKNAKLNGQPHSNLYTTTAGRTDTECGKYMYDIVKNSMPFSEKLYDSSSRDAAASVVAHNSKNGILNGTFSHLQLGYTNAWLEEVIRRNNTPPDEVDRDYKNMWKSGTELGLLSADVLKKMNEFKTDPLYIEMFGEYAVYWYKSETIVNSPYFKQKVFVLGLDSSEQIGRDYTTGVLVCPETGDVVATFRCNESNTTKLSLFIADFLMALPNTIFIPERKSTGITIIDTVILLMLEHGQNPFKRIYNRIVDSLDSKEMIQYRQLDKSLCNGPTRKYLGFMTASESRSFLYKEVFNVAVPRNAHRIYDSQLIRELSCLTVVNGRIDHSLGEHDDMVIAYLLAFYLIMKGKNTHVYGLSATHTVNFMNDGSVDTTSVLRQMELRMSINKFKELSDSYLQSGNIHMHKLCQCKLNELSVQVDPTVVLEPMNASNMVADMKKYGSVFGGSSISDTYKQTQLGAADIVKMAGIL